MAFVLNCLGLIALCCVLAVLLEQPLVKMMPAAVSLWILVLYLLALIRRLHWIDGFSLLCLAALSVFAVGRFGRKAGRRLADLVFASEAIALYVILAVAFFLWRDIVFMNRDSVGCWAMEVRSVAYFDGFAPIWKNAAVEFGSYAPGTTLFRWWTVHLLPARGEDMIAVGSAWLFVLLLAPLLSPFRGRRILSPLLGLYAAGLLLFLPSIVGLDCFDKLCAELPITAVYTQGLCALLDKKDRATMPRLAATLFCMSFFKSSGLAMGLSLLALLLLLKRFGGKENGEDGAWREIGLGQMCGTAALSLAPSLSWTLFCRLTARSSYFTFMLPGEGESFSDIWEVLGRPFAASMVRSAVSTQLQNGKALVNFTLLVLLVFFGLLFWLLVRYGCMPRRTAAVCALFFYGMTAILILTLFIMHTFVFRETIYFDPEQMIGSITRYGNPILAGWLIALAYLFLSRGSRRRKICAAALLTAFVLLCSPIGAICSMLRSYGETKSEKLFNREQNCTRFANCMLQRKEIQKDTVRILLVYYRFSDYMPSRRYFQYEVVPDSIVAYELLKMESPENAAENIRTTAREEHAEYLYCCEMPDEILEALSPGETIENGHLYPISNLQ